MPKFTRSHPAVVTVKLSAHDLEKLDTLAVHLRRSRADMPRQMIACAQLTGQPDIRVVSMGDDPAYQGNDAA